MSDTRTDREELGEILALVDDYEGSHERVREWEASEQWEKDAHPDNEPFSDREDAEWWNKRADAAITWFASRAIPRQSTIAVPHTPEEIWAFADVGCDLDFWARTDLEYTDDGVTHLASNVNITPDTEHMPDHLRPDIGVDRL
jgi:hypothetical protein